MVLRHRAGVEPSRALSVPSVPRVKQKLEWANSLRGIAAATVVLYHLGICFWVLQPEAAAIARRDPLYAGDEGAPRSAEWLDAIPLELGALGVGLFFLLSGYVIAISLDKYSRRGFVVGRCMRLLPTYAAAYLVTCLVIAAMGDPNQELSLSSVLVGSVPGLQFLLGVPAPANGIVWTLIIELIFYGVCLVAYRDLTKGWEAIALVAGGCVLLHLLVQAPAAIEGSSIGGLRYVVLLSLPFLPVLLIGVALSNRSRGHISALTAGLLVPALAGVHVWLMVSTPILVTTREYKVTFLVAIALFCAIWAVGHRWNRHAMSDFAADISYPLYVVHPVLGYALMSLLAEANVQPVLAFLITTTAAVITAWLLHRLVEIPTHRLGQRWARNAGARSGETTGPRATPHTSAPASGRLLVPAPSRRSPLSDAAADGGRTPSLAAIGGPGQPRA